MNARIVWATLGSITLALLVLNLFSGGVYKAQSPTPASEIAVEVDGGAVLTLRTDSSGKLTGIKVSAPTSHCKCGAGCKCRSKSPDGGGDFTSLIHTAAKADKVTAASAPVGADIYTRLAGRAELIAGAVVWQKLHADGFVEGKSPDGFKSVRALVDRELATLAGHDHDKARAAGVFRRAAEALKAYKSE